MKKLVLLFIVLSSIFAAGCTSQQDPYSREYIIKKDYDKVWNVTIATLKETYKISYEDKAKGVAGTQIQIMNGWQISQISQLWFPAWMSTEMQGRHSVNVALTRLSTDETKLTIVPTMEWGPERAQVKPEEKFYQDLYTRIISMKNTELLKEVRELMGAIE